MSAIKKLIISLIVIIGILAVALISVYIVARVNLGVDLFRTVGQLKTLSQPVNEQESFPAAYRSEDLADLKSQTDSQLGGVGGQNIRPGRRAHRRARNAQRPAFVVQTIS